MIAEFNSRTDSHPEWCDPFPEPRTLPIGWELSELPRIGRSPDMSTGLAVAAVPDVLAAELMERLPDPFPEPRTIPCGWDLSDVLALERERMREKNGDGEQLSFSLPISLGAVACEAL
jgi:hypothetical protein